jgi:multicomponent Na+:H+ antiporter subunit E
MTPALRMVLVVACWCAVAGAWTPAQLLLGFAVAVVVELLLGAQPLRGLRILPPLLRLALHVLRDLVVSSCRVAVDVLRPRPRLRPRLVEIQTDLRGPQLISALANAISLTPGSLTLQADADGGRLLVHLCYGDEATAWTRAVEQGVARELARLGSPSDPAAPPFRGSLELLP